ncbi:MAG TPA: hypothetical protein GXX75_14990 [Clostridiales bacterium]|nr:hypothetical protein [Clostridiales bacterium]
MKKIVKYFLQIIIYFGLLLIVFYFFDKFYKDIDIIAASMGGTTGYIIVLLTQRFHKEKSN